MEIIKPSELSLELLRSGQNGIPLIICTDAPRVKRKLTEANYRDFRLNIGLSKKLLEYKQSERPEHVERTLTEILSVSGNVFISEFEMLFDPRYKIDVLKFFCDRARLANVAVKWPGKFSENKLSYANPGDPDYHVYNCNSYQIRIIE